jgi:class 3 adenylate cyclase/TolB-like protein
VVEDIAPAKRLTRRLRAVLFVDVVDSVRLIQKDADGTIGRWRDFVAETTREELPSAGGRMVKHTGDGMLVEFDSVIDAVEAALAMQERIERGNVGLAPDLQIHLRMGVHLGDVMVDDIDIYGDGVNLAARLMVLAGPREIVVSAAVRDQLTDGLGVTIEDLGERQLKGIDRPIRAFRAWPPGPPLSHALGRGPRVGDRPLIAVLPFRNLSREPAQEFLGDMIAEDLIGDLSRLTDLSVISRLSTTPFRDRLYEPRSVAEALGARYVLSGNMQSSGTRLRLMAELTEADVGQVIWAERFEGSLVDLFELQDQLSRDISQRVVPYLRQRELRRARSTRPENLSAYERTLRAVDHLHRTSRDDLNEARSLLETAIAADPHYGTAHAWLARWHVLRVGQGWSPDRNDDAEAANRHADIALEIDDLDSWALSVRGLVSAYLEKDLETAIATYDRALTINPSAASAWAWSTAAHAWLGHGAEAVRRSHRAIELSPFDPHMYVFLSLAGTAHAAAGQYDAAIDLCRRSMRNNRMYLTTHRILAISLALSGRADEARQAAAELLRLEPELTVLRFRQRYPGSASAHVDAFCGALAAAGVPA